MIKRVFDLGCFHPKDNCPLTIRAFSLFDTYGADCKREKFFSQHCGGPCAMLVSFFSDITLITFGKADYEEIAQFLKFTGFSSIVSTEANAKRLFGKYDCFCLMQFAGKPQEKKHNEAVFLSNSFREQEYREIYALSGILETPFNVWYSDFALKVTKKAATGALYYKDKQLVSMALITAKCDAGAIVGCVITREHYKGNGYASMCLQALGLKLNCKIYLCCSDELKPFYEKNGFANIGRIAVIKGNAYEWI